MFIDSDFHNDYANNVILTGRTSCMRGFADRLRHELGPKINVIHSERDARNGVWKGASRLARNFKDENWFSRAEYEENGPSGILRYS